MHDFAVISLSDCLTPWEVIIRLIRNASASDFILCLYNPKSRSRTEYIGIAREELLKHRSATTPAGIVWNAGREGERSVITNLDEMLKYDIDMFSVVIVGNTQTYVKNDRMLTPRRYKL